MLRLQHILLFIAAISLFKVTTACKCAPTRPPLSETYAASTAVFIGTALEVTTNEETRERRIVFKPSEVFKGAHCLHRRFIIYTNLDSAACGVYITKGQQWQIWATGTKERLQIHSCGQSTDSINDNIEFLRQQKKS